MGPSNISFLSFRVIFHFHDYGRKCIYYVNVLEIKSHPSFFFKGYIDSNCYSVFVVYLVYLTFFLIGILYQGVVSG